jgi:hypothetical protein
MHLEASAEALHGFVGMQCNARQTFCPMPLWVMGAQQSELQCTYGRIVQPCTGSKLAVSHRESLITGCPGSLDRCNTWQPQRNITLQEKTIALQRSQTAQAKDSQQANMAHDVLKDVVHKLQQEVVENRELCDAGAWLTKLHV